MSRLIKYIPKRLFTFGCSFTNYIWPTWANIIAFDLDVPLYNYGASGAGNQYIFNSIMQADNYYNFNQDDLVIVCWTNISREDRYIQGAWQLQGNIYTQSYYDSDFIKKYVNEINSALRDFAMIKASYEFLKSKNCQYHFLKMLDFEFIDQWTVEEENQQIIKVLDQYSNYLSKIEESFVKVLWNNDLTFKRIEESKISPNYIDGHPNILEHYTYLEKIFTHEFSENTKNKVQESNKEIICCIRNQLEKNIASYAMSFDHVFFAKSQPITII